MDNSVPRRPSAGASHYGRGGAANVFKGDEDVLQKVNSKKDSAVDDSSSQKSGDSEKGPKNLVSKVKQSLFGKKA
jgi:hypothetical protein